MPTHVFASAGKFTVLLKVSNETGPSQVDGDGLTILPATAFPSVEFTVSKNLVKVGDTIVFSWSTKNATKGIRIENAQRSSFQPVLINDPRPSGTTTLIARESMAYTITAFGDAVHYTPLTPLTVQVVGSAKGRAVRH
jgi:PKD repeat protein